MVILLIDLIITVGCTFRIPDYSPVCLHPHLLFVSGSESHFYFSEPLWYWVRSPPYSRTMCLLSISKMTLFPNHILRYLGLRLQNTALEGLRWTQKWPFRDKKACELLQWRYHTAWWFIWRGELGFKIQKPDLERWRQSSHLVRLPSFGGRQKYSLAHTGRHYTEQDGVTLLTRATRPRVCSSLVFIYVLTQHALLCLWSVTRACFLSFGLPCSVTSWRSSSRLTLNLRGEPFWGGLFTVECELAFQKADELKFWCPL